MTDPVSVVAGWVVVVGAALGVVAKAIRDMWKVAQRVHDVWELVTYELQPNDGASLKDEVQRANLRLDELERLVLEHMNRERFDPPTGTPV